MLILTCPNCGPRNVSEFREGGEYNPRPREPAETDNGEWTRYLYLRRNTMDLQTEWWYHRSGCGLWFLAERQKRSNEVLRTYTWRVGEESGKE